MKNYPAFIELLERVMVLNRDNGERFKDTHRLDAISAILWNSPWKRIDSDGLLNLYSQVPVMDLPQTIVVVSSHVDCERNITQCFTRESTTANTCSEPSTMRLQMPQFCTLCRMPR